jgi:hypothetical protein
MSDQSNQVYGLDGLLSRISSLPKELQDEILADVSEYAMQILAEYPQYRYISRAQAYGQQAGGLGWFSDAQRRYVMAAISEGKITIPYTRTGNLGASWTVTRSGDKIVISNSAQYAPYVVGFAAQSRHEKSVGWKKITDTLQKLSFRSSKFRDVVMGAVMKAIRKLKLG